MNRSGTDPRPVLIGAGYALDGDFVGLNLYASLNDFGPCADIASKNPTARVRACATQNVSSDTWQHLVVTNDGNDITIFVDGTHKPPFYTEGYTPHTCNLTIGDLCAPAAHPAQPFTGSIDEVRIYDRTLSADEVMQHSSSHYRPKVRLLTPITAYK